MKNFRSYFILILVAAFLTSCSGLNKMKKNSNLIKYDVTPKVLVTDAGLVPVTIKGTLPAKYFEESRTRMIHHKECVAKFSTLFH